MSLFKRKHGKTRVVVPNQVFLHGSDRFEPGERYTVDINLARYFERNGWVEGSTEIPGPAELDVDDSTLGVRGGF